MIDDDVFLDATVPPLAAARIVRDYPRFLRELEADGHRLVGAGQEVYGRQVLRAVSTIRTAGRKRLSAEARLRASSGTAEVPETSEAGESEVILLDGMTAGEVAERFGFAGARQVSNLISAGRLSATRATTRGRPWVIDPASVEAEDDRRKRNR